jgi:hypothetical protein
LIVGFNLIMLILIELPLLAYTLAPDRTPEDVDRFKAWFNRNSRVLGFRVALVIGALLIVKGVIELL